MIAVSYRSRASPHLAVGTGVGFGCENDCLPYCDLRYPIQYFNVSRGPRITVMLWVKLISICSNYRIYKLRTLVQCAFPH